MLSSEHHHPTTGHFSPCSSAFPQVLEKNELLHWPPDSPGTSPGSVEPGAGRARSLTNSDTLRIFLSFGCRRKTDQKYPLYFKQYLFLLVSKREACGRTIPRLIVLCTNNCLTIWLQQNCNSGRHRLQNRHSHRTELTFIQPQ